MLRKYLSIGLTPLLISVNASALDYLVDGSVGSPSISSKHYDSDLAADLSGAVQLGQFQLRLGGKHFDDFILSNSASNAYLQIAGIYAQSAYQFEFPWLNIEVGAGALYSQAETYFNQQEIDNRSEVSPFAKINFVHDFNRLLSFQVNLEKINQFYGEDVTIISSGIRFNFSGR